MPVMSRYRAPFRGYRSLIVWIYCGLWVYPLFGQSWHRKWWYVAGGLAGTIRMDVGLRRFTTTIHCGVTESVKGDNVVARMCDKFHEFEGEYELSELYDHVCLTQEAFHFMRGCGVASVLYWTSTMLYVFIIATMVLLICCAFLILYFETGEPSKRWKSWCQLLYFFSLGLQGSLVLAYSALNFNLDDIYKTMNIAGFGELVFNSPSNLWITASFTAWYALAAIAVGFVAAWWTVLDLRTEDQLFDELMVTQEKGLNPLEKEILFGDLAGGGAQYGATDGGAYGYPPAQPAYGVPPPSPGYAPNPGYAASPGYAPSPYGHAPGAGTVQY